MGYAFENKHGDHLPFAIDTAHLLLTIAEIEEWEPSGAIMSQPVYDIESGGADILEFSFNPKGKRTDDYFAGAVMVDAQDAANLDCKASQTGLQKMRRSMTNS